MELLINALHLMIVEVAIRIVKVDLLLPLLLKIYRLDEFLIISNDLIIELNYPTILILIFFYLNASIVVFILLSFTLHLLVFLKYHHCPVFVVNLLVGLLWVHYFCL
jgi:hypothetical protein